MWLVLPERYTDGSHIRYELHALWHREIHVFHFDATANRSNKFRLIGTSRGHIMMEDARSHAHAFDVFTRTTAEFPRSVVEPGLTFGVYRKAILVQRKTGDGKKPVFAVVLRSGRPISELAFAPFGAEAWTDIALPTKRYITDIAADDDGNLYVLANNCQVFVFDLHTLQLSSYLVSAPARSPWLHGYLPRQKYLGMMSDELIMLRSWTCQCCPRTFEVFRFRASENNDGEWVRLIQLSGHAILLGDDGFVALHVREFPDVMADCIFYIDCPDGRGKTYVTVLNLRNGARALRRLSTDRAPWFWFVPGAVATGSQV
ncbi:LOW protein: F-box/kelch-repeat protein (DUF295) [Wolffia australiana]